MKVRSAFFMFCACFGLLYLLPVLTHANPITGVYRITPRGQQGMCLDVTGFGNGDENNVQIWYANHTSNQQWLVQDQGDGTYKIYAYSGQNSLEMLDLTDGSITNNTPVRIYHDNGNSAQRWIFKSVGGGYYRIIPANAGLNGSETLEILGGNSATAGSLTDIYDYWGGDNQVFKLDWAGPEQILPNSKKGIGGRETKTAYMNCSWVYNWGAQEPGDVPTGVEFVPMIWGFYGGDQTGYDTWAATQPGVKNILGFNEPDQSGQANLSVGDALTGFQYLSNLHNTTSVGIGSPACADDMDSWMQDFINGALSDNYHIDFVTVHCYIRDPYQFENYITAVHNMYWQWPLWITEFAPADWSGTDPVSVSEAENFMNIVVPWLNSQWYVAWYAWYTGASPGPWTLGSAALVNNDGTPTALGQLYARM